MAAIKINLTNKKKKKKKKKKKNACALLTKLALIVQGRSYEKVSTRKFVMSFITSIPLRIVSCEPRAKKLIEKNCMIEFNIVNSVCPTCS